MDIELAVDMLELSDRLDHAVLFSGDGDFRRLVEAVQQKGVRVTVVSSIRAQPPLIADELRRQADNFIDLVELQERIQRRLPPDHPRAVQRQQAGQQPGQQVEEQEFADEEN
jgi:uncharacterized LabA/DUF88 family protein